MLLAIPVLPGGRVGPLAEGLMRVVVGPEAVAERRERDVSLGFRPGVQAVTRDLGVPTVVARISARVVAAARMAARVVARVVAARMAASVVAAARVAARMAARMAASLASIGVRTPR